MDWNGAVEVLEVGTGTGRFWTNQVTPRSAALTLTDLSPGMVRAATDLARSEGYESVVGRECDVQDLPFDDASFDVVVANHMLYHVPDPDLAVGELARVLRAEGVLLASTNGYGHMREMSDAISEAFGDHQERLYEVFGIDSGEHRLRQAFASISWHAYDNDLAVTDLDAAVAYGRSFPPGEDATEVQAAAFREALQRRFSGATLTIRTRTGVFVCRRPRIHAEG